MGKLHQLRFVSDHSRLRAPEAFRFCDTPHLALLLTPEQILSVSIIFTASSYQFTSIGSQ